MKICIDLDNTICENKKVDQSYSDVKPKEGALEALQELKKNGHEIIIFTARHMKTCENDESKVIAKIGKITIDWLEKHDIPYDGLLFSKPNCDLIIDDKAFRHENWQDTRTYLEKQQYL